jgi:hypothetical protein
MTNTTGAAIAYYDPIRKVIRRTVHVSFNESVFPAKELREDVPTNRGIAQQEDVVEMEPPGVEKPIDNKGKKAIRFNLLPAGRRLIPREDVLGTKRKGLLQIVTPTRRVTAATARTMKPGREGPLLRIEQAMTAIPMYVSTMKTIEVRQIGDAKTRIAPFEVSIRRI